MMVPSPGQIGPMMRTISETNGDLSRRPNPGTGHFNNLDNFNISPNCSRSLFHTSNFSSAEAADRSSSSSNMLIEKGPTPDAKRMAGSGGGSSVGSENHSSASSEQQAEDEDGDLEMIFMSIGALNSTGIDESEDDVPAAAAATVQQQSTSTTNSTFASIAQRNIASVLQQQQQQQPLSHIQSPPSSGQGSMVRPQQQQPLAPIISSSPHGPAGPTSPPQQQQQQQQSTATTTSAAAVVTRCTDGKLITYNPDIYEEADILLSNEKNVSNIRYLKEFRVEQCGNFLQHKCNQHKPFSCFNWHFANQRRRRPIRRRDGTFNYSPDTYCSKYDETTGNCPDGEECPNLHRTAGDTERRYHLRYYKTGMCVYETDRNTGFCMKNGAHCAFAHGQHDLRQPIFDSRDSQANADGEAGEGGGGGGGNGGSGGGQSNGHGGCGGGLYDKDRNAVNEDPRWQDIAFVLANYKTDICKRPPRLCRQGYACPQYHNNKDRRRTPKNFNYRSTPCPSVKQGDEWGDPSNCENEEKCQYCHTRTEQQFHPEIYKSTKCNDIQQSNHCPRGPFCAFAHSESCDEIKAAREFSTDPTTDLPPSLSNANHSGGGGGGGGHKNLANLNNCNNNTSPVDIARANSLSAYSRPNIVQTIPSSLPDHFDIHKYELATQQQLSLLHQHEQHSGNGGAHGGCSLGPIARPRSFSTSASTHATNSKSGVLPWSLLEKNNLLGNKGNNIPHSNNNSLGSTIFSAASSSTSLYQEHQNQLQHQHQQHQQHQQQQQQHQQSSSSSFTSTLTSSTGTGFFGMSQQSSAEVSGLMESVLSHMEETLSFAEGGGAGGGAGGKMQVMGPAPPNGNNAGGSVLDNPHNSSMGGMADMANNSLGSVNVLRRSSLLNDPSAPINIPGQRIGPQSSMLGGGADPRSASATGFNLSPPMIGNGQMAANSPSSFIGPMVASSSVGSFSRQTSCPPGSSSIGSSQSIFDAFPTAMNLGGGGGPPQNTPVAHSALAQLNMSKQEMAMMVMEVQRYRDENLMQKTQMFNLQNLNQMMQQQFQEAAAREKMAEKARDEAIDMLNSTQKELEMVRNTDSFRRLRPNELSGMSLQQLYQIQQQIQQDLQYVDEAIQRASI